MDTAMRTCVKSDLLTFSVAAPMFERMVENMDKSFLTAYIWESLKNRLFLSFILICASVVVLAIDQIISRADTAVFVPVSEINLRMTMGLIARNQYDHGRNLARQLHI